MKFLEDVVKKTLKKLVLKVARKGKAPSEEVPEDGVDQEANGDSLNEGIDFVVGEGKSSSYELKAFIAFLLSRHLFDGYPHEKILSRHFPLVVKLARGRSFPFGPYFLGILYSHLDHFTLDLQCS